MKGWSKLKGCCSQAIKDDLEYTWIDSCCIDKTSSVELSEAINSMFRWYQDAEVCYAYLSDVVESPTDLIKEIGFRKSKWFTRGWTLQELLAPDELVFFDRLWQEIGSEESLQELLKSVTGIQHLFNFEEASIAQKMSWASRRVTTRSEDTAYCLMGLFGVNMPPLYGEGPAAFLRLQLEIMKTSTDESIFAWKDASLKTSALLASSPSSFKDSGDIKFLDINYINYIKRPPFSMTNKGLQIDIKWTETTESIQNGVHGWSHVCPINCAREGYETTILAPFLFCERFDGDDFERVECGTLDRVKRRTLSTTEQDGIWETSALKTIYVQQPQALSKMRPRCYFRIDICRLLEHGCHVNELHLRTPELGHWGKDFNNGFALRLSSSVALLVFKMGTEIILLRIFTQADVAGVELPVCWQLKASFALTDGLLQDPPIIPPEVLDLGGSNSRESKQCSGGYTTAQYMGEISVY